jgi:hypothetical protein
MTFLHPLSTNSNVALRRKQPAPAITAELIGATRCEAQGIVATGYAPVLTMCRELLAAGFSPDAALAVYRRGILTLRIRSIAAGARLAVEDSENGRPQFRLARPERRGAAPPMRSQPDFDRREGGCP